MTYEELLEQRVLRDADGVLIVLEEVDEDARVAWYRRNGETIELRASSTALADQVLPGEAVEVAAPPAAPARTCLVAVGVAAAGVAILAARRRR